eukprot:2653456-Prorocentrum_lima.AAC.1
MDTAFERSPCRAWLQPLLKTEHNVLSLPRHAPQFSWSITNLATRWNVGVSLPTKMSLAGEDLP